MPAPPPPATSTAHADGCAMLRSLRVVLFLGAVAAAGFLLGQELSDRLPPADWPADPVGAARRWVDRAPGWAPGWRADPPP